MGNGEGGQGMALNPESDGGGICSLRRGSKSSLQFHRDVKDSVRKRSSLAESNVSVVVYFLPIKVKGLPVILNDTIFMKLSLSVV